MADDVDDEAVLFEGSPLLLHLQDVGEADNVNTALSSSGESTHQTQALQDHWSWQPKDVVAFLGKQLSPLQTAVQLPLERYKCQALHTVLSSRLLSCDDRHFLQVFNEALLVTNHDSEQQNTTVVTDEGLTSCLRFLSIAVAIAALAFTVLPTLLVVLIFVLLGAPILLVLDSVWVGRQFLFCLQQWKSFGEELQKTLKKSLQLIKEVEVVRHGFVRKLAGTCVPDNTEEQQFRALRLSVITSALSSYKSSKRLTQQLREISPLKGTLDAPDHYLSYTKVDLPDLENLNSSDTSVSSLKMFVRLQQQQQSECLRRLLLSFSSNAVRSQLDVWSMKQLHLAVKCLTSSLQEEYDCARASLDYHLSLLRDPPPAQSQPVQSSPTSDPVVEALQSHIHNLQLHLHNTMQRSTTLQDYLSEHSTAADSGRMSEQVLAEVHAHLQLINVGLTGSQSCFKDAECKLHNFRQQQLPVVEPSELDEAAGVEVVNSSPGKQDMEAEEEPETDKVFEAYVEEESSDDETPAQRKKRNTARLAEMERQQQELEEALRMVEELKAVLAAKQANSVLKGSTPKTNNEPSSQSTSVTIDKEGVMLDRCSENSRRQQGGRQEPHDVVVSAPLKDRVGLRSLMDSVDDDGKDVSIMSVSQLAMAAAMRAKSSMPVTSIEYGSLSDEDEVKDIEDKEAVERGES